MYQFSRAIYRELSPHIVEPPATAEPCRHQMAVLKACEAVVTRLATEPHYFAHPAKTLFCDIRSYFLMTDLGYVYGVVNVYMTFAQQYMIENPSEGYAAVGGPPPQCRATTRKGSACQRAPLAHNGYCPSHQHLADTENREPLAA